MSIKDELLEQGQRYLDNPPTKFDLSKCQKCGAPVEPVLHACPYSADVNNDPTPTCNCCEDCAHECAMDI